VYLRSNPPSQPGGFFHRQDGLTIRETFDQ
jgi:hypothetical protein